MIKNTVTVLALFLASLLAPLAYATETPATPATPVIEAPKVEKPTTPKPHPLFNPAGDLKRLQGGMIKSAPEIAEEDDENIGPEDLLEQPKLADSNDPAETTLESGTTSMEEPSSEPDEDLFFYDLLWLNN